MSNPENPQTSVHRHVQRVGRLKKTALLKTAASCCLALAYVPAGMAANPLAAIFSPTEWDLPLVEKPTSIYLQSAFVQRGTKYYDKGGDSHDLNADSPLGGNEDVQAGVSRYAYFFPVDALPDTVRLGFEYFQPYAHASVDGAANVSLSGLADPLFLVGAAWVPSPSIHILFGPVIQAPFGGSELGSDFWGLTPLLGIYTELGHGVSSQLTLGYSVQGDQHGHGESSVSPGDVFSVNEILGYRVTPHITSFVSYTYQHNDASHDANGNETPGLGPSTYSCLLPGSCQEQVLGAGLEYSYGKGNLLMLQYARSIEGRNTIQTNALIFFFRHPIL